MSDFHVMAEGWHGGPELGTQLRLCPVDGAVFACGSNKLAILHGDRLVRDPALESGLPGDRWIYEIVGKWPDSAWLLYADPGSGNWSYAVYRWTKSRWVRVLDVPQGMVGLSVQIVPWKGGALARVTEPVPGLASRPKMRFVPLGVSGALPQIPAPLQGSLTCAQPLQYVDLQTTPTGDLIGSTTSCDGRRSVMARWTGGSGRPVITDLPACPDGSSPGSFSLSLDSGITAFGACGLDKPYLARLEGEAFRVLDTSGLEDEIRAYARKGDSEYVVTGDSFPTRPVRLLQRGTVSWQEVPLPRAMHAPSKCDRSWPPESPPDSSDPRRIIPTDAWVVGADTWIAGYTARSDCLGGNAGVLLRSSPPGEVLHLP